MSFQRWAVIATPIRGEKKVVERFVTNHGARRACAAYLGNPAGRLTVPGPDGWPVPLVDYSVERIAPPLPHEMNESD